MKLKYLLSGIAALALSATNVLAAGTNLVIVEAYGGGGNSGSTYKCDFIGLFNRGTTPVDVTGWSVQYASSAGTSWQVTPLNPAIIPAGGYYLIQETNGAGGTVDLPTPDTAGITAMGATGFKVALVNNTTALVGAFPTGTGPTIVDFVGASGAASGFEGSGPAPTPSNTTSVQRINNGCADTDVNTNDFVAAAPTPRNSATPIHSCAFVVPPLISGVTPSSFTTNAGNAVTFTVSLSQGDTPVFYQWYTQSTDGTTSTLIPNATNNTLSFLSVLGANSTNYVVVVTNNAASANSVTSSPVTLTVIDPALNSQPASQIVITNGNAQFSALAGGTGLTYKWYFCSSSSDNSQLTGPVSDGLLTFSPAAGAIGSTSNILTITNVTTLTQTNFALVVTGTYGSITSSVASLTLGGTAVPLAFWNFNGTFDPTNALPFQGIGLATPVNVQSFVQPTRDANDLTPGNNTALGTQNYPAAAVSNKQSGVQFNVSTRGAKNIKVSFDLRGTATASQYQRLQYTTNGTDFIDYPASQSIAALQASTYNSYNYDLTGFPGVANNPNFGIRLVTEFQSTATYGNSNTVSYVGVSSGYSTAGTLSYDLVDITGDAIAGNNQPPTVGTIPATVSVPDVTGSNITFTATDDSTPAGSLVANATSLDPSTSVGFSVVNTAGSIKLTISPNLGIENPVSLPVLVTVADGNGEFTAKSFLLTITPANSAPVIGGLVNTNMLTNSTIAIPFTLTDDHTPAASLTPSITSSNSLLVPNNIANVSITGSGTNRTLNITPALGQSGAAPLYISVTDGGGATLVKTVVVEVRPNTDVMLIDNFDYDNAGPIINVSGGLWANHSGTVGQMQVGSGVVTNNNNANSEDVNAPLFGAPYVTNMANNISLYATYKMHYLTLPNGTNGSYITHFKDNTIFGFLGRVWASTNNAAPGSFRLGIGNSTQSNSTNAQSATDLSPGVDYTVVVRIRMTNGFSTLWINPTDESSPSVTDTTVVTNLVNIYQYAIRESTGGGIVTLDNLKVGTSFAGVTGLASTTTPSTAPTISGITIGGPGGTNVIISGTNNLGANGNNPGSYVVLTSTNLTTPLSSWSILSTQTFNPDGSFSFTNGITAPNHYYILQVLPTP